MESIRLKNFRCFEDTKDIEIKPLTFLVGANSSGKSSFLKLFPLLKQSLGTRRHGVLLWNIENGVDFEDFKNTLRDGSKEMTLSFTLGGFSMMNRGRFRPSPGKNTKVSKINMSISLKHKDKTKQPEYISNITIYFNDQKIIIDFTENKTLKSLIINDFNFSNLFNIITWDAIPLLPELFFKENTEGSVFSNEIPMKHSKVIELIGMSIEQTMDKVANEEFFQKLREAFNCGVLGSREVVEKELKTILGKELPNLNNLYIAYNINNIIDSINMTLMGVARNTSYVEPLRAVAQRYYRMQNIANDEISPDGTNLAMFLFNLESKQLADFNKWTHDLFGFRIKLKATDGHVQIMIHKNDKERNMTDVGFGYSQILPILAIIWDNAMNQSKRARSLYHSFSNTYIIAIEQPELHLHPRFISDFADMLAKIVIGHSSRTKKIRFIIETHSSILIERICQLVGGGDSIKNTDVNILLFNARQEGMAQEITPAKITPEGYLTNWPYGFFSGDKPFVTC